MSNKKKSLLLIGSSLLATTIMVPQVVFAANSSHVVNSLTVYNVDATGTNFLPVDATKTKVDFDQVTLKPKSTTITGTVTDKKSSLPFSLKGSLSKAEDNRDMIVGHLEDELGNFEVLNFSLDRSGSKSLMFDRKVSSGKAGEEVLKLYLLQKGTRNVTVVELANPSFLSTADAVFAGRSSLPTTQHMDEFWYPKLLKPVSTGTESTPSEITPNSYKAYEVDLDYPCTYNVAGDTITEHFNVQHYTSAPGSIAADTGQFFCYMKVTSEETDSYDDGKISNDTNTKIGQYAGTTFDAATDEGDAVNGIQWDATYTQGASFSTGIQWSYELPGTGVSFSPSYTNSTTIPNKSIETLYNGGSTIVRDAGVEWDQGKYLQKVGDEFQAWVYVGNYDSAYKSSYKTFEARWTYDISNGEVFDWGGQEQKTVYSTYGN